MLLHSLVKESSFLSKREGGELNDYLYLVLKYVISLPVLIPIIILDVIILPLELISYLLYRKDTAK